MRNRDTWSDLSKTILYEKQGIHEATHPRGEPTRQLPISRNLRQISISITRSIFGFPTSVTKFSTKTLVSVYLVLVSVLLVTFKNSVIGSYTHP
jgi:hypothetical protein